jgi:hypothetical protein
MMNLDRQFYLTLLGVSPMVRLSDALAKGVAE